jgi:hypothetical protein
LEALPVSQRRFDAGALKKPRLFAGPQTPFTPILAEQLAEDPPLMPVHFQDQGPEPLTVVGFPALQRFAAGSVVKVPPLAEPQTPLTTPAVTFVMVFPLAS